MSKKTLFIGPYCHHLGSRNSLACYRIVRWICTNVPGCEHIQYDDFTKVDCYRNVDNVVYFYSSFYAKFDELILFMKKQPQANLFWLYNEYTLAMNSSIARFFKERSYDVITNLADGHSADITNTAGKINVINTNVTAYRDEIKVRPFHERKHELMYYGTYRPDRQEYVNEYFRGAYVSTSPKNMSKFKSNGLKDVYFVDLLVWGRNDSTLNNVKFSVYIEDKSMHQDKFSHLSDRFYECVSNGVVLFFDINCKKNVSLSGYNIPEFFFVKNRQELDEKMKIVSEDDKLRQSYFDNVYEDIEREKEKLRQDILSIL
jgi:hypothetical protein